MTRFVGFLAIPMSFSHALPRFRAKRLHSRSYTITLRQRRAEKTKWGSPNLVQHFLLPASSSRGNVAPDHPLWPRAAHDHYDTVPALRRAVRVRLSEFSDYPKSRSSRSQSETSRRHLRFVYALPVCAAAMADGFRDDRSRNQLREWNSGF